MPMQTAFNDGAPEYGYWAPEEKGFHKYWDSEERVRRGKERKARWNQMDPNEARSIRRARRKAMRAGNVPGLPMGAGRPRTVRNASEERGNGGQRGAGGGTRMAGQRLGQGRTLLGGKR